MNLVDLGCGNNLFCWQSFITRAEVKMMAFFYRNQINVSNLQLLVKQRKTFSRSLYLRISEIIAEAEAMINILALNKTKKNFSRSLYSRISRYSPNLQLFSTHYSPYVYKELIFDFNFGFGFAVSYKPVCSKFVWYYNPWVIQFININEPSDN